MGKRLSISILALVAAILALGVAGVSYLKISQRLGIEISEAPPAVVESEGSIYTGTGTGLVIEFENGKRFYFAGDTTLFYDMKAVIGDYYQPDVAFIPIGDIYTMDAKQAALATTWINPAYVLPYHYHTFPTLTQTPDNFVSMVNSYRLEGKTRAQPLVLEYGVEKEIEGIKVTWLGHSTLIFESPTGTRMIYDPWLEANPDCPAELKKIENLKKIDIILITHGHVDHVTWTEIDKIVKLYKPIIITQWEMGIYLQHKIDTPIYLMNIGGTTTKEKILLEGIAKEQDIEGINGNIKITLVQALHSSSPP